MVMSKRFFEFFDFQKKTLSLTSIEMEGVEKRSRVARLDGKCKECWLPIEEDETLCFFHFESQKAGKAARYEMVEKLRLQNKDALFKQKRENMGFRRFGLPRDIIRKIWNFVFEAERFHEILFYAYANDPLPDLFDALLFNKEIWQKWWMEDFPDFVEDLGTSELPDWALQSTTNPWRKYYLHSRFLRMGMGRLGMWVVRQKISDIHFKDLKYGFGDWTFKDHEDTPPLPEWRLSECFHDQYFADSMKEYESALYGREVRPVPMRKAIKRYFDKFQPHWVLRQYGPVVLIWTLLKYLEILPADLIDESAPPHDINYRGLLPLELHISSDCDEEDGIPHGKIFESMLLWYMRHIQMRHPNEVTSSISYYSAHYNLFSDSDGWVELRKSTEISTFTRRLRHNETIAAFFG